MRVTTRVAVGSGGVHVGRAGTAVGGDGGAVEVERGAAVAEGGGCVHVGRGTAVAEAEGSGDADRWEGAAAGLAIGAGVCAVACGEGLRSAAAGFVRATAEGGLPVTS